MKRLEHLSPTLYEALLRCKARAAWVAGGDKNAVPQHPRSLLGSCYHGVVEDAHNGELAGPDEERLLTAARERFDRRAGSHYERAHPLLRVKFASPERLPHYNIFRERAARDAAAAAARVGGLESSPERPTPAAGTRLCPERRLVSRHGLLVGRPDLIDLEAREIVDYKTGAWSGEAGAEISEAERRQLKLYVHLALDNGLTVSRTTVARADGRRASVEVSKAEADAEGRQARESLAEFNSSADRSFDEAARPSPDACTFCPCIPFCEPFWRAAAQTWADRCGVQLEGRVASVQESMVQGVKLLTLHLEVRRGTVAGDCSVEQVPEAWTIADGSERPREGDLVRVVHGRLASASPPAVVRVDRAATSVWTVTPASVENTGRTSAEA